MCFLTVFNSEIQQRTTNNRRYRGGRVLRIGIIGAMDEEIHYMKQALDIYGKTIMRKPPSMKEPTPTKKSSFASRVWEK